VTCKYCDQPATQTLVWLFDRQRRPARIRVPWCGCDLMTALKRFWPNPSPVREGYHYECEPLAAQPADPN
jgi:hypothetical protein